MTDCEPGGPLPILATISPTVRDEGPGFCLVSLLSGTSWSGAILDEVARAVAI